MRLTVQLGSYGNMERNTNIVKLISVTRNNERNNEQKAQLRFFNVP